MAASVILALLITAIGTAGLAFARRFTREGAAA
jgi:hypothetical protein